jgi:hypothetical protein
MIRIKITNIPKKNSTKLHNRFTMSVGIVHERYEFRIKFYSIDFYLNPNKFNDKPLRYVRFFAIDYLDKIASEIYQKINDLPQDHPALTENFSIELFLKRLRASMFDERLAIINFFIAKKECLDFSMRLLDLVDEKTTNKTDYEEMENFLTTNLTFMYLLS